MEVLGYVLVDMLAFIVANVADTVPDEAWALIGRKQ